MKRWNGWGDEKIEFPIPEAAKDYLTKHLGEFQDLPDAEISDITNTMPASKLKGYDFISTDPLDRIRHSCAQSLPDWIHMRSGRIPRITDGVTYPESDEDIELAIDFAKENHIYLIPYGGGTSVVGHINPPISEKAILTLDLSRLNKLLEIDEISQLANFQAGIRGPELESALNKIGYTLGHFPQSFEYSTLGGWITTRSCGQQSYHYGRIEDIFRGGKILTPIGRIDFPPLPASAAGPDQRQIFLGSEGKFGIVTRATVQITPLPEFEGFYGVFFRNWEDGVLAVRKVAQKGIKVSMLRLSDARETETTLILAGRETLVRLASIGLDALGYRDRRCLLIFAVTGDKKIAKHARSTALEIFRKHGGVYTGYYIGKSWQKSRFFTPYLRNSLWASGYALDTLETALSWENVSKAKQAIIDAISGAGVKRDLPLHVFGHLSHVYHSGASIYITYLFRRSQSPEENLRHWRAIKEAASQVIINHGGTISHQHGVGVDHAKYLSHEKGTLGIDFLKDASRFFDPDGIMNPQVMISSAIPERNPINQSDN
jgi:alkyldihydroxyacetonephosphate synthase